MTRKQRREEDERIACDRDGGPAAQRVQDTGGIDDKQASTPADLRQASDWVQVWRTPVLDRWRGGLIEVAGSVTEDAAGVGVTYQYSYVEFRIIGYVGSAANYLRRGALGGASGPAQHLVEEVQLYTEFAVEARKIIDGQPGSAIAPTVMNAHVIARFIRS
jgi:hypothetical protein